MRKYLYRKDFDEKDADPSNAPRRTIFFHPHKSSLGESSVQQQKDDIGKKSNSISIDDLNNETQKNSKINDVITKKLFQDSFSAIEAFNDRKMELIYKQLEDEKKLSEELNEKLHENLSKIAKAESELVKKKNNLELELKEKTKKLVESERLSAIGELSSRVSHDLKNPLTVIKGTVGILKLRKGMPIDDFVMKRLELMEASIFRMTHQIDGVLDYVQHTPLDKKDESLKQIIENSLQLQKIPENIRVILPKKDSIYNCDRVKMEVVMGNLLLNSIQAIGLEKGQILIEIVETPIAITITIQDSGSGVPNEHLQKIFDPLFTTKQEGTGLGLSSVQSIIDQHGGIIDLKNNPTTVTITLPKRSS
ncbi:sensor histidine kinase [Candidatus Nitrosarchaeum limnium]|jgi:signal transduction histidine kinase|uniref:ATPase/histidine kinase/DNA gyrase B/HSP90 domain protein n=1 Tax=Candidatus Nitrosarchaeum limnium BG20 TaxID=859192 RepID=S2E299_9ARCH|nr:ATP-binding protein [Candidatus Nitrosarchaeum limnium]EPA05455.1 ATPase/histidine kinase/DNA gyrase B/HSP90 domain protein [Candidatus Nitrosarchaeum limnium BG20]